MTVRKSIIMMGSTGREWNVTGDAKRADSYFGYSDGLHTVSVTYANFTGGFKLQGTLALEPEDEDWFDIGLNSSNCSGETTVYYPKDETDPTTSPDGTGDTGTDAFTFIGNFTYLRAILTRDYIDTEQPDGSNYGQIEKVLLAL